MRYRLLPVIMAVLCAFSCGKETPAPDPTPSAPTAISLTPSFITAEQEGGDYELIITAPARPKLANLPNWVTLKDGTFKDYKITLMLKFSANPTYEERNETVTVSATGASDVSLPLKQYGKKVVPDPTLPDNDAVAMSRKLGFGWNLGNQMEAHNNGMPDEKCWTGTLCTQETFNKVAQAGISSVRIPVSWIKLIGEAPDYTLDATRLARLKEIVGYAHEAGLITIMNIHHDGADSQFWLSVKQGADDAAVLAQFTAVWKQLAEAFRDYDDWLIFESCNEIHDGGWGWSDEYKTEAGKKRQNDILNSWNQAFVTLVRDSGGKNSTRWLGVPGYAADVTMTLEDGFKLPDDPAKKTMVAVHTYGPYEFGQTCAVNQWGHTRNVKLEDPSYDEEYHKSLFNRLYTKWVANNVPVYFGEFGCANRTDANAYAFQLYFLEYMTKCMHVFGMPGFIWDNGAKGNGNEVYGIFDHGTGAYLDPARGPEIIATCLKGLTDQTASYTLQSVYDSAPKF